MSILRFTLNPTHSNKVRGLTCFWLSCADLFLPNSLGSTSLRTNCGCVGMTCYLCFALNMHSADMEEKERFYERTRAGLGFIFESRRDNCVHLLCPHPYQKGTTSCGTSFLKCGTCGFWRGSVVVSSGAGGRQPSVCECVQRLSKQALL